MRIYASWDSIRISSLIDQRLPDRIENVDEIARTPNLAHHRDLRQHLQFPRIDLMQLMNLLIAAKFVPRASTLDLRLWRQHRARVRIGDEEKLAPIEAEHIRHPGQDLIRRMPLAGLDVPDIRGRGFYSMRQLVLGEFQLTAAVANHLAK